MENKLYEELDKRIIAYQSIVDENKAIGNYDKASEYSFYIKEILRTQMLMIELGKEVKVEYN